MESSTTMSSTEKTIITLLIIADIILAFVFANLIILLVGLWVIITYIYSRKKSQNYFICLFKTAGYALGCIVLLVIFLVIKNKAETSSSSGGSTYSKLATDGSWRCRYCGFTYSGKSAFSTPGNFFPQNCPSSPSGKHSIKKIG